MVWMFGCKLRFTKLINSEMSHQLDQLDNARGRLEVPDVESDLQRLGVGAGVGGDCDLGMTGRFAPSIDVTHHLVTAVSTAGD